LYNRGRSRGRPPRLSGLESDRGRVPRQRGERTLCIALLRLWSGEMARPGWDEIVLPTPRIRGQNSSDRSEFSLHFFQVAP
jgi:hypothetical protein